MNKEKTMFGLTKREQWWKAEQRAAELFIPLVATIVRAESEARVAEAHAGADHQLKEVGWVCEDGFPALLGNRPVKPGSKLYAMPENWHDA